MKKILLFNFLLLSFTVNAQLKLKDLLIIYKSDIEAADIHLLKKGFEIFKTEPSEYGNGTNYFYALNRTSINNRADGFLAKRGAAVNSSIWYQIHDKNNYENIKNELKILGYKRFNDPRDLEYVKEFGGLRFSYTNGKIEIKTSSSLTEDNRNEYTINIY
jgi:hypothetical protein